ncbi:MAG: gamma-glutamyl hercynylcysteine S-oxide synthase, partial [Frankiaceae bacterium]|nr:gamma-glutamyl hercynylcysteine S-oxide synthase [Frankiaceae bacterium]
ATGRKTRYPWGDTPPTPRQANVSQRHLQPAPAGAYPEGASPVGAQQMLGDVWEWTATSFTGHPGFCVFPYREYSEVFFGPEYQVLRGGSWATDEVACRTTFRNWDYPIRRQIFSGFRTARDS